MALVLDGNSEQLAHLYKKQALSKFGNALDLIECLRQIKIRISLFTRALISELRYNIFKYQAHNIIFFLTVVLLQK